MTRERKTELYVVGAAVVAAVLFWALVPTYPNYDAYYALDWGREIVRGHLPTFQAYQAPTQHPLYLVITAFLGLFGTDADRLLVLFTCLCHVAFTYAVYRLGTAIWDRRAGAMAAFLAGSSFALLLYAARAYVDEPFLALVLCLVSFGAFSAPININTASAEQLTALNGIGEAKAAAIVEHRKAHGPFKSVDQLVDVKGIGLKLVEKNRDMMTVGDQS